MKAFLASFALALLFAIGTASAGTDASQDGGQDSGCSHYNKWQDT